VLFGSFVGAIFAAVWFKIHQYFGSKIFAAVESWRISKILLLRDTSHLENVFIEEYKMTKNYNKILKK
jgi:hypothetical protein